MTEKLADSLMYPPRTFRADRAAAYLSMATSTFLKLVEEGILPKGIKVHRMTLWDRHELDAAFDRLKSEETERKRNTVDMVLGLEGND
jgi:predicted DNA-binding transcriptional regulator AlpA